MQRHISHRFRLIKVWAKNFRSVKDSVVLLNPLTVLVGRNAAGKSNLMDILRFVKDALGQDLEAAISLRRGTSQIRRWQQGGGPRHNIEIGLTAEGNYVHRDFKQDETYNRRYQLEYGFVIASESAGSYKVKREYANILPLQAPNHPFRFEFKEGTLVYPKLLSAYRTDQPTLFDDELADVEKTNLALPTLNRIFSYRFSEETAEAELLRASGKILNDLRYNLARMRFYSIFPNAIREPQKLSNPFPLDEHGGNFASVLRNISRNSSSRMQSIRSALQQLVPSVSDLRVTSIGGYLVTRLKHDVAGRDGSAWFDLSQESDGTLRLLGLLVALHQGPRLPLIGIEEPELTVHPGTVVVLGDIFKEVSRRCQLLITTHSPDLIDQLPVESLRVVELAGGRTTVGMVSHSQVEAVRQNLFSPGELHRMGELNLNN